MIQTLTKNLHESDFVLRTHKTPHPAPPTDND